MKAFIYEKYVIIYLLKNSIKENKELYSSGGCISASF